MTELPLAPPIHAPVRTLMLYLTEDCNLRCTYCFVKKSPRTMSLETVRQSVDFFLNREVSGNRQEIWLTFFGGEPFIACEQMEEAIHRVGESLHGKGKRLHFSTTTNATFATDRVERIVRDNAMSLLVSLDGGEEAMASRPFLGGGNPFRAVTRNLRRLVEWSSSLIARMTFHPEALDLRANVERVLDLGAPSIALCPVNESDWGGHEERLEEANMELAEWFVSEACRGRFLPLEVTWQMLRAVHHSRRGGDRPSRPCEVGTSLLAVDPDGFVMPCHRFLYRKEDWLGRVEDSHFPPQRRQYLTLSSHEILGCQDCSAEPICGGGCRALVLSQGGDLRTGAHPGYCLTTRAQARASYYIYDQLMEQIPDTFQKALHNQQSFAERFGELTT